MEELKTARAQLVHARIAPRKVQIVCDMIRGKDTKVAEAYTANTPKAGCELMLKLLEERRAPTRRTTSDGSDNLYVAEALCHGQARSSAQPPGLRARMYRINKRTSHITIVVAEKRTSGGGRRYGTES
ncbi:MAG: large ribosomal subunit protein uL22 [Oscillospiraceae bacterium]